MSQQSKKELLERWRPKYQRSGRKRKSLILSEFCELTDHDRKHAIKLLNGQRGCRERPPGRKPLYDSDVADELHALWLYTDQLCSKLLKAAIPDWLAYYEAERGGREVKASAMTNGFPVRWATDGA